jgi:hypothetical protein
LARRISARLTPAEGRKFGLVVGGAFLVIGALLWWRAHFTSASIAAVLGSLLIVGGLVVPGRMGPVYRAWMALALAISKVTTPVIMAVMFFLILTPSGLLARLFGHRPLSRPAGDSYWLSRPAGARRGKLDHQF